MDIKPTNKSPTAINATSPTTNSLTKVFFWIE